MRTATPAGVTTCSLCGNQSVHLRKVKVLDLHDKEVEITVGRCVICDTRPLFYVEWRPQGKVVMVEQFRHERVIV